MGHSRVRTLTPYSSVLDWTDKAHIVMQGFNYFGSVFSETTSRSSLFLVFRVECIWLENRKGMSTRHPKVLNI